MKNSTFYSRTRQLFFVLALSFFIAVADIASAGEPLKTYAAVQELLADTVSLQGKVVYIDFWASWCHPCRQSFPWMQKIYDKYHSEGFEIIAVNVDKDHRSATKFLDENAVTFPIAFDSTGNLAKLYGLEAMPSSFVYDRQGHLVSQHLGFREEETRSLEQNIEKLLNKETSE